MRRLKSEHRHGCAACHRSGPGIPVDELLETIKSALLTAYRHTQGHEAAARIDIDRKSGIVKVMARETDDDGNLVSEWDDTLRDSAGSRPPPPVR